jgi:acetyl esterase/lipase
MPTNIRDYRIVKEEREAYAGSFLQKPEFALLKDRVAVVDTKVELPEAPGHRFDARIYRPAGAIKENLPVMVYFHGGWWCAGSADAEDLGCRAVIARGNKIVIFSFEYRRIPEVGWDTVFSDAENAVKWMAANGTTLNVDVDKGFLVGGADAGAQLAVDQSTSKV